MPKGYTTFVVRTSLVRAAIILLNLAALGTFFFIQVGSIFFIVPAAIIDVMYLLNQERVGPKTDAVKPSAQVMKLMLYVVLLSLIIFSAIFLMQVYKTA